MNSPKNILANNSIDKSYVTPKKDGQHSFFQGLTNQTCFLQYQITAIYQKLIQLLQNKPKNEQFIIIKDLIIIKETKYIQLQRSCQSISAKYKQLCEILDEKISSDKQLMHKSSKDKNTSFFMKLVDKIWKCNDDKEKAQLDTKNFLSDLCLHKQRQMKWKLIQDQKGRLQKYITHLLENIHFLNDKIDNYQRLFQNKQIDRLQRIIDEKQKEQYYHLSKLRDEMQQSNNQILKELFNLKSSGEETLRLSRYSIKLFLFSQYR